MALYLLTKGIATGTMLVCLMAFAMGNASAQTRLVGPVISIVFLVITAALLVADLDRPERFYYILIRPNWGSWMVWGAYFLTAQGLLTTAWIALALFGADRWLGLLWWPLLIGSILTTGYTGFLFAQGLARDLWQGWLSTVDLFAQAIVEGSAVMLLASLVPGYTEPQLRPALGVALIASMIVHVSADRVREPRRRQPHAPSAAGGQRHPPRRLRAALLGRRDRRRRRIDRRRRAIGAAAGRPGPRCRPRPGRQLRVGIHLGRGGAERSFIMRLQLPFSFPFCNPAIPPSCNV